MTYGYYGEPPDELLTLEEARKARAEELKEELKRCIAKYGCGRRLEDRVTFGDNLWTAVGILEAF